MSKITKVLVGLAMVSLVLGVALAPAPASAQTAAELQALIASLQAQIASLTSQLGGGAAAPASTTFTRDLTVGSVGDDVKALQVWLNAKGFTVATAGAGAPGMESTYFGAKTKAALAAWQAANGITPASGYFGPKTRAAIAAMGGTTGGSTTGGSTTGGSTTGGSTTVSGGAGSATYDTVSKYSNEEVGEDEEDVAVAGLEIEVDESSDIRLTSVKLVFDEGTASSDFEDYASEVSVWLDGEEIARVDADEFNDDNDWTKSISLDSGAVIKADDTANLIVKVSGISNLDSGDAGDTWTVDFRSIRFVDGQGASTTEDPTIAPITFSFDTFASAAEVEMKVSLSNDNPDEQTVIVDNDGDEIVLMEMEIEADGSDITINDLPINLVVAGATDVDLVVDELVIEVDGEEFSESVSTSSVTSGTVTFDDIDLDIADGDTMTFLVKGISATSSILASQGVTITASTTVDNIDADDETGEAISDADATGAANGDIQHLYTVAPEVSVVSVDIDPIDNGTAPAESAKAVIKFSVTARGGTIYLNGDNESTENKRFFVGKVYGSGVTASTTASTTIFSISGDYTVTNSGADNEYYTLNEDDTVTITVESTVAQSTVTSTAVSAGLKALLLQFGTDSTSDTTRSAVDLDWSDLTDNTETGTWSLVNPS